MTMQASMRTHTHTHTHIHQTSLHVLTEPTSKSIISVNNYNIVWLVPSNQENSAACSRFSTALVLVLTALEHHISWRQ